MRYRERTRAIVRSPMIATRLLSGRYDFVYDRMPISMRNMSWPRRVNMLKSGMNLFRRRSRPWSRPLHMQFELAGVCNLHCPVCPTGTRELERNANYMDPGLFEQVYAETAPYLLTASLWGWGESALHPRLRDILSVVNRYDAVTFLSTNGMHLRRPRVRDALLDFPPSYLIVAIDGLTDETNSRFRVGARLETILEGVRQLAKLRDERGQRLPVLHMRFMVMDHNEHELPRVESFARDNGFDMLSVRSLSIVDSEKTLQAHDRMIPSSSDFRAYDYEAGERIRRSDYVCMQPFWYPSLYSDGRLVSCEQDFNATEASGRVTASKGFLELWNGPDAARVRSTVRDHPETYSFCRNCPAWDRDTTDTSISATFFNRELVAPFVSRGKSHE